MTLVVAGAEVDGRRSDVRIEAGGIGELGPRLTPAHGEDVIDAAGGALIPGLHDHHVHLRAMAAAAGSVIVGPPGVPDRRAFAARLSAAAAAAATGAPGGWIRAVGYHESVAGLLDRRQLDAIVPDRPVRVQHRGGALWILNSEAVRRTGLDSLDRPGIERGPDGTPTGRLWRADGWLATVVPATPVDFDRLSAEAAALGVTGFTDATPNQAGDVDQLAAASSQGAIRQRLHIMTGPASALTAPAPAAPDAQAPEVVTRGPVKLLLDDVDLPSLDELVARFRAAHHAGRPVAVHCVTRAQLVLTCAGLAEAGTAPGDRIEHASVVPSELTADLVGLGVTVVTQPNFVAERGDQYLADVEADDLESLYRCRTLVAAGIPVAFGTDAPFGGCDPWAAMTSAVGRRTAAGEVLGPGERVAPAAALRGFLGQAASPGTARRLVPGAPADLCLLAVPLAEALRCLDGGLAAVTIVGGRVVADNR